MDISWAFDNVKWHTLIDDMRQIKCTESSIDITVNYLENRTAKITLGSASHTTKLTRG